MPRKLAKLARPRLVHAVRRTRLFDAIDSHPHCDVLWISAPPGSGKTTLIASYLDDHTTSGLWYQVDDGDRDPATFFYYLGVGAKQLNRRANLPLLTPEYLPTVSGFSRRFFRSLFSSMPPGSVLVLDNVQELGSDCDIPRLISDASEEIPAGIRLMLISRTDPPPAFARLRVSGRMCVIDWSSLRLTIDESKAILSTRNIVGDQIANRLHSAADGWAAGLTLLIEDWMRQGAPSADLSLADQQAVFDYFASVVFERSPLHEQEILILTSFLPRFNITMAAAITEDAAVAKVLDDLANRHMFIHRRGTRDPLYQYHALFREFLLSRARRAFIGANYREKLSTAARIMESAQYFDDAFLLYCEAADWNRAMHLLINLAPVLLDQGRWQTLLNWIRKLPPDAVDGSELLLYWYGKALISESPGNARVRLEASFLRYRALGDPVGQILTVTEIIGAYFVEKVVTPEWSRWFSPLRELLHAMHTWTSPGLELSAHAAFLMLGLYCEPKHPLLRQSADRILALLDDDNIDVNARVAAGTRLLNFLRVTGNAQNGSLLVRKFEALIEDRALSPLNRASGLAFWGLFQHLSVPDYDSAERLLSRAEAIASDEGLEHVESIVWLFQSWLHLLYGMDLPRGEACLDRLAARGIDPASILPAGYSLARVYLCEWRGDWAGAHRHALDCLRENRNNSVALQIIYGGQLPHVLAESGELDRAMTLIQETRDLIADSCLENFSALLWQEEAYLNLKLCNTTQADRCLREALVQARHDSSKAIVMRYMGMPLPTLLARALEHGVEEDVARDLIRTWRLPPPAGSSGVWPVPIEIHTLGRFRISVDGKPLAFGRKAPKKVLSLLKALVALGADEVPEQKLIDHLWAEQDGDAAHGAYVMTLLRLRRLLGLSDALIQRGGCLSLNRQLCRVDATVFEQVTDGGTNGNSLSDPFRVPFEWRRLFSLYQGPFLAEELDAPWVVTRRERLRARLVRNVGEIGSELHHSRRHEEATSLFRQAIETDPLTEAFYAGLIRALMCLGRREEAVAVYAQYQQTLLAYSGRAPSPQMVDLLTNQIFQT